MWLPSKLLVLLFGLSSIATHALVSEPPPPVLIHVAIGALSGSAGAIAAYPIDYVKSQLQTEDGRKKWNHGFEAAFDIVRSDGPLSLYRGAMVNVIGVAPEKTIKLGMNSFLRGAIQGNLGYLPIMGEVFAGGVAGMTQVIVTNPLEVIKVRMQTSDMTIKEVASQLKGPSDFYEGVEACIARDVIFSATLFPLYAHAKVLIAAFLLSSLGDGAAFWANLIAGSFAAAPAAFIATPADVIKTRMQQAKKEGGSRHAEFAPNVLVTAVGFSSSPPNASSSSNSSLMEVLSSVVAKEGPTVLFSGWAERVMRSVPQFGVTLAVFDVLTTMATQRGLLLIETAM